MPRFSFEWFCIMSKPGFVDSNSETDETNELDPDPEEIWERVGDPGAGISMPEN